MDGYFHNIGPNKLSRSFTGHNRRKTIMKINDRHLMAVASNSSPVDKEGYLSKRGEVNKAYQKRWFVLKGNLLFYMEKKGDREPIGVIILEGCTVELAENTDAYAFELVFQGTGTRTYVLASETQDDMECWMKAIACAGYEYMKLMVAELQRQLDELSTDRAPVPGSQRAQPNQAQSHQQQDLLVSFDDTDGKRQNPFHGGSGAQQSDSNVDMFGAVPFNANAYNDGSRPRTFEEMHQEFGEYIQKRMREHNS